MPAPACCYALGLIPFWSKDGKSGYNTINARAETVATSAMYREPSKRRRLVPAGLFYDWQKTGEKTKRPYAIGFKDDSIFAFAGLWDSCKDKTTGRTLETCTALTTGPNSVMEPIHNRMPVILKLLDYERWLAPGDPQRPPMELLRPFDVEQLISWQVSVAVGNVRNSNLALCVPVNSA